MFGIGLFPKFAGGLYAVFERFRVKCLASLSDSPTCLRLYFCRDMVSVARNDMFVAELACQSNRQHIFLQLPRVNRLYHLDPTCFACWAISSVSACWVMRYGGEEEGRSASQW